MSDAIESRVARIESDVEHIATDTADLRVELRRTNDKIDSGFKELGKRIDDTNKELITRTDGLKDKLHSLSLWALLLYIGLAGGLLTVMAHGFKWI